MQLFSTQENAISYFRALWSHSKPIFKLFGTTLSGYLYDTGTNKIVCCSAIEYDFLSAVLSDNPNSSLSDLISRNDSKDIVEAIENIRKSIEIDGILQTKNAEHFGLSVHYDDLRHFVHNCLRNIQLEVTEACNLRCEYCIYNPINEDKREHGHRQMSLEIAVRSIDYLSEHSSSLNDVNISFYGGEPLLRMDLIKACVEYAHKKMPDKNIGFSVTTNGTLLGIEEANYFYNNNFSIMVSLDGPEIVHDLYRKDIQGNGSYKRTLNGLLHLIDAFRNNLSRISLSMVYAPPFSEVKLDSIAEMWERSPFLPKEIHVMITYPQENSFPSQSLSQIKHLDLSLEKWARKKFWEAYNKGETADPISRGVIEKRLAKIYKRYIYDSPVSKYHLNGCCIPAARKLFIAVDGKFHLCEKIADDSPSPGTVQSGIDLEILKKYYIDEYDKKSISRCSTCWAIQLCGVCYVGAFKKGKFDAEKKERACFFNKLSSEIDLSYFCQLIEANNSGLDYLSKWVFS